MARKIVCTYQLIEHTVRGVEELHRKWRRPKQRIVDEALQEYIAKHLNGQMDEENISRQP